MSPAPRWASMACPIPRTARSLSRHAHKLSLSRAALKKTQICILLPEQARGGTGIHSRQCSAPWRFSFRDNGPWAGLSRSRGLRLCGRTNRHSGARNKESCFTGTKKLREPFEQRFCFLQALKQGEHRGFILREAIAQLSFG